MILRVFPHLSCALRVLGFISICRNETCLLVAAVLMRIHRQERQPVAYLILLRLVFFAGERCAVLNETDLSHNWSEFCWGLGAGAAKFHADALCGVDESRTKEAGKVPEFTTNHLGDLRVNVSIHFDDQSVWRSYPSP